MFLIFLKISNINIAVRIDFVAIAVFLIVDELALIHLPVLIDCDT